jgi:uncharacterized phiE125 gp8 family phage protein
MIGCEKPIPSFVLKTPPIREPIGLDDVKAHSRIVLSDDDLLIQGQIRATRQMVERMYDLAFITQTWTMYLDWLPYDWIEIFKRPIQSVTSVKYIDSAGITQTIANNLYMVDLNSRPPRIVRIQNATWTSVDVRPSAVAVEFIAGYGDDSNAVPQNILSYLMIKTADFYENRESYTEAKIQGLDFIDNLISSERLFSL